jgi:hypothetical protein
MADNDTTPNAEFIGRVVGDAKNPPETRMLTGWLGDAGEEGYRRLYTDAELNAYVDIPDDAILYTEPIRDVQPSGGVFVWIKRDAALQQGGSAYSRAARFLQGQVQQDYASGAAPAGGGTGSQDAGSIAKAGFRCMTQVPCAEPTGLTGECTKQPDVGGAWPCITAIPHCFEPTGFTGQCTHQPWPNPTRYVGCTIFHCPTHDLTHNPQICNIVMTGLPGCGLPDPRQAGDGDKAGAPSDAEAKRPVVPPTQPPGCGYTKSWGLCETQLPGCGWTKDWALCHQTVSQGMEPCTKPPNVDVLAAGGQQASAICATAIACDITRFCPTSFCAPTLICPTQVPLCLVTVPCEFGGMNAQSGGRFAAAGSVPIGTQVVGCNPSMVDACATHVHCATQPVTALCTKFLEACETKAPEWCTTKLESCPTTSPKICPTKFADFCPDTSCGPKCQTQQVKGCPPTPFGPACPVSQFGVVCPSPPPECTMFCTHAGMHCPHSIQGPACPVTSNPVQCPPSTMCPIPTPNPPMCYLPAGEVVGAAVPIGPTALRGCTRFGPQCPPTPATVCTQFAPCPTYPNGDCTFFGGCQTQGQAGAGAIPGCTQLGPQCPPTPATVCTQFAPCPTYPNGDCTFFGGCQTQGQAGAGAIPGCTQSGPQCPPTPATVCTQFAPCHTYPNGDCTFFGGCQTQGQAGAGAIPGCTKGGPQCPPTPATVCTQFAPCHTYPNGDCTFFGGCGAAAQPQAVAMHATPWTRFGPHCPTAGPILCTGFRCQTPLLQVDTSFEANCNPYTAQLHCTNVGPGCPPNPPPPPPLTRHFPCPSVVAICPTQICEAKATGVYCEYETQAPCTHFPCNMNTYWRWCYVQD